MTTQRVAARTRQVSLELPRPNTGPWSLTHFGWLLSLWLIGLILLAVAWAGSRSDAAPTNGGLWILLGILGGMIAGAGSTSWLLAGLRTVRHREQILLAQIAALTPDLEVLLKVNSESSEVLEAGPRVDVTLVMKLVRVERGTLYHSSECPLVVGKKCVPVEGIDLSLAACGVCCP